MKNTNLTPGEINVLRMVSSSQIEEGYSEYDYVSSSQEKGILGSLVKKQLVYDAYAWEDGDEFMYCLTQAGFEMCQQLEISTAHIIIFN
jgi:hypothetical protein